jgi:membrane protein implicated in regulation of membrane protease activity
VPRLAELDGRRYPMLWLILGIILLVIAIAGGAIVHPVLFVLGLLAVFMFISGWRGRGSTTY